MAKKSKTVKSCSEETCEHCAEDSDMEEAMEAAADFLEEFFNDCIIMKTEAGDGVPLAVLATESGSSYIGGLVMSGSDGAYGVLHPLRYVETIGPSKTVMCGLFRPYQNLGLPNMMIVQATTVLILRPDNSRDKSMAEAYYESVQKLSAEDAGITIAPPGTVIGRA